MLFAAVLALMATPAVFASNPVHLKKGNSLSIQSEERVRLKDQIWLIETTKSRSGTTDLFGGEKWTFRRTATPIEKVTRSNGTTALPESVQAKLRTEVFLVVDPETLENRAANFVGKTFTVGMAKHIKPKRIQYSLQSGGVRRPKVRVEPGRTLIELIEVDDASP